MVNELAEERHSSGMGWIVPVDQTETGIRYQQHGACCQIVVRIHNPARTTKLHKSVANRIRWRGKRRQITEHPTKMSGQRWIWRRCGVVGLRSRYDPKAGEREGDEKPKAAEQPRRLVDTSPEEASGESNFWCQCLNRS